MARAERTKCRRGHDVSAVPIGKDGCRRCPICASIQASARIRFAEAMKERKKVPGRAGYVMAQAETHGSLVAMLALDEQIERETCAWMRAELIEKRDEARRFQRKR